MPCAPRRDFGTTSSVRFALRYFVEVRRRYLAARENGPSLPLYADSSGMEASEGHAYRKAQEAAVGVVIDPQIKD